MQSMKLTSFLLILFFTINLNADQNILLDLQDTEYLAFADEMPQPVGGMPAIYALITYPTIAIRAGIEGKVYVLAFINEEGGVDEVKIVKGLGAGCDEAAIKAVKQTKFMPGKSAGKLAKIKMSLQIQFKLN